MRTKFGDGIEECGGEALDTEVDGGEETVVHEDEVPAVGVRYDHIPLWVKEGRVALNDEAFPTGVGEELMDLRLGGRGAGDGGLADQ